MLPAHDSFNLVSTIQSLLSFKQFYSLACGHSFCHLDIIQLLLSENIGGHTHVYCPTCHMPINSRPGVNYALRQMIERWIKNKDSGFNFNKWQGERGYAINSSFFAVPTANNEN